MTKINILIIDDAQIYIEGIKCILESEPDINIIGEAHSVIETKHILENNKIDLVLLDISLEEESDGLELAHYIKKNYSSIKIIIISHYKRIHFILKALQYKVNAYLAKDTSPTELIISIKSVSSGNGLFLGETLPYDKLLTAFDGRDNLTKGKPHELTPRELQIITLLSKGYYSKEIASELDINITTVESYKERIKTKLGFDNIISVIVFAIKQEIINT